MSISSLFNKIWRLLTGGSGYSGEARVLYSSDGRSGYVHYQSAEADFALYYEFGGGDCVAGIDVPKPEDWEDHTGLPLARREEILHFIGRQVVKDQTTMGRGYYRIEGNFLNIYV